MSKKYDFIKDKEEIEDGLFVSYSYNVETRHREEDFHGHHLIDDSEVTELHIDAVYLLLNDDYAKVDFSSLSDEQIIYIESKLKYNA